MTIAERVINKLSELDKELESVYETSNAIQRLQKEAESCEKDIDELKKDFIKELEGLNGQKNHYKLSIQALEQSKQKLDKNIESILTVYKDELTKIGSALTLLTVTKLELSALEEKLTQAFSGLDNTISNKLSKYIDALDSKLEPKVIEHLTKLDSEIAGFKNEIDTKIDKNLTYQNKQLDGWVNTQEVWLQSQLEESKKLIDQIKSSEANHSLKINELTKQANDDLKGFKEEIVTKIDDKLQRLSNIEREVTGFINKSMRNTINQLEQTQTQFLDHQRALVDQLIQRENLIEKNTPEINSLLMRIEALEEKAKTKRWFGKG